MPMHVLPTGSDIGFAAHVIRLTWITTTAREILMMPHRLDVQGAATRWAVYDEQVLKPLGEAAETT